MLWGPGPGCSPHEVNPAALPGRSDEHRGDRRLESEVVIGDDQLHAVEASGSEAWQERSPERASLAVSHGDAEDFAVSGGGHTGSHHHGAGHDPAVDAAFDVGGVGGHLGELDVAERPLSTKRPRE